MDNTAPAWMASLIAGRSATVTVTLLSKLLLFAPIHPKIARDGADLAGHASEPSHQRTLMVESCNLSLLRNSAIRNHRTTPTFISLLQKDSMSRQTRPATEQATVAARFS